MLPCSSAVTKRGSTKSVPWVTAPKQESVSLVTRTEIGFGTGGDYDDSNTSGNIAILDADNGNQLIKAMRYILVEWEISSQELLDHTVQGKGAGVVRGGGGKASYVSLELLDYMWKHSSLYVVTVVVLEKHFAK